jgi:CheY-like chemotaxis protein
MKPSILIIDDNVDLRELLEHSLARKGFSVRSVSSGREGLALLESAKMPDLILLDIKMPDMTGYQFLDELEASNQEVFDHSMVVFFTSEESPRHERVAGYIDKMSDFSELLGKIRMHIANCGVLLDSIYKQT